MNEYRGYRLTAFPSHDGWSVLISHTANGHSIYVSEVDCDSALTKAEELVDRKLLSDPPPRT